MLIMNTLIIIIGD